MTDNEIGVFLLPGLIAAVTVLLYRPWRLASPWRAPLEPSEWHFNPSDPTLNRWLVKISPARKEFEPDPSAMLAGDRDRSPSSTRRGC